MLFVKNKQMKFIVSEVLIILLVFLIEVNVFMRDTVAQFSVNPVSVFNNSYSTYEASGYDINGVTYMPNADDPHIIFTDIKQNVRTVHIILERRCYSRTPYRVYYSDNSTFDKQISVSGTIPFAAKELLITVPDGQYHNLRIDIDGKFHLYNIQVSSGPAEMKSVINSGPSVARIFIMLLFITTMILCIRRWHKCKNSKHRLSTTELLFCLGCFIFYSLWAVSKSYNYASDESLFYSVTSYLYNNSRLPVATDVLSDYGFSFSHLPTVLFSHLGNIAMKLASAFTKDSRMLLLAARGVSVLCSTGAVTM